MAFMTPESPLESRGYRPVIAHRFRLFLCRLGGVRMAFYIFYVIAIAVIILHFTGWLKRNNLEWLVLVLAVAVFPAVLFL